MTTTCSGIGKDRHHIELIVEGDSVSVRDGEVTEPDGGALATAVVLASQAQLGALIGEENQPPLIDTSKTMRDARQRWLRYFERMYVTELLLQTNGNVSAAAALAGVDRVYMHRMITRCGLREVLAKAR